MARMVQELNNVLPEDAILVADGGFAAHWTGLIYDTKKAGRGYIPDRGMASIGYGVSGGIGAQLAAPDRPVFTLTGDGGLNMTLGDLETAARLKVPVTVLVVNNAASGYIKALQHAMFGGRYQSADLSDLNYAKIAENPGLPGYSRRASGRAGRRVSHGPGKPRQTECDRHRGDPGCRQDAARRGQPHRPHQEGRPDRLATTNSTSRKPSS